MVTKRPGRPLEPVRGSFYITAPTEAMIELAALKNDNRSWRQIANELSEKMGVSFSAALIYRVAKGEIESERVEQALGLKPKTAVGICCLDCGDLHTTPYCTKQYGDPIQPPAPAETKPRPSKPRTRIAADVEIWERQTLYELAASKGLTWTQYCKQLAAEQLKEK